MSVCSMTRSRSIAEADATYDESLMLQVEY